MIVQKGKNKEIKNCPDEVPNEILSEEWAQRNHGQSLERLNERGGMCVTELICNINKVGLIHYGYDFHTYTQERVDLLNQLILQLKNRK